DMFAWIRVADLEKALCGKADHPTGFVHFSRCVPAAHGEDAVCRKMTQEYSPGFDRVQAVLAECESSRSSRSPSIDHTHFNNIKRILGPCKPTPSLVSLNTHTGHCLQAGIILKARLVLQQLHQVGIKLNSRNVGNAKNARREHIAATAHSDNGRTLMSRK